jgi:hypothetical protein
VRGTFGSGGEFTPMVHEVARRRGHRLVVARTGLVHGHLCDRRVVLPRLHAVGAADGPTPGDDCRDHHRRTARLRRIQLGNRRFQPQRLPRVESRDVPPGGCVPTARRAQPEPSQAARRTGGEPGADGPGRPGTARDRRTLVGGLGRAPRPQRPLLGSPDRHPGIVGLVDAHLGGEAVPPRRPVRAFVTNGDWLELRDWPPPMTDHVVYLQPMHRLRTSPPTGRRHRRRSPSNPRMPRPPSAVACCQAAGAGCGRFAPALRPQPRHR